MTAPNPTTTLNLKAFFPYRLSILEQKMSESIAQHYVSEFNLGRYEWRVMATLAMHQHMTATAVANFTRMEKMQVSRAIRRLKETGLVDQKQDSTDRRATLLSLTEPGMALYDKIVPQVLAQEQRILDGLSEAEQAELQRLTDKLDRHLTALEQEAPTTE